MPRINANLSSVTDEDMEQKGGWSVFPDGDYRAMLKSTDYKPTNAGDGMCLHLSLMLLDEKGKEIRDYLTLEHPNPTVVKIAKARLKQLAIAVGHETPNNVEDSDSLLGAPFLVRLYSEVASNPKYGDKDGLQNKIGGYKGVEGQRESGPRSVNPPPEHVGGGAADNDIPF